MEMGFSSQERGLTFRQKKAPLPSKLTERRQEETYFRQMNKCRMLWLVWPPFSLWTLRRHRMPRVRDVEVVGDIWGEVHVWNFQHGTCQRELTRGKRRHCGAPLINQTCKGAGQCSDGLLSLTTLKPSPCDSARVGVGWGRGARRPKRQRKWSCW